MCEWFNSDRKKMGKTYTQRFRTEWLSDARYKNWLLRIDGDDRKCRCKYCSCTIAAKLYDIEKHRMTNKHKKAAEPFSSERHVQRLIPFQKVQCNETKKTEAKAALFIAENCPIVSVNFFTFVVLTAKDVKT